MKQSYTLKTGLAILPLLIAQVAFAQESTEKETMVVTASGFTQSLKEAPASISVVTREELETGQFRSLTDALRDIEGVDVLADTGKTGGLNISIRGMPAEYTLILIDGRRQNAGSDVTPNGFDETGNSFLPPLTAIERIEIIRGPMSTLYGSDAMGGVVNIITRKIPDVWSTNFSIDYLMQQHSEAGKAKSASIYAAGSLLDNRIGLMLRGKIYQRDESLVKSSNLNRVLDTNGPNPVEADIYNLGGRLSYAFAPGHLLSLDLDSSSQWYNNDRGQLGRLDTPKKAMGYKDSQRYKRFETALTHQIQFDSAVRGNTSLMYNKTETIGRSISDSMPAAMIGQGVVLVAGNSRALENKEWVLDSKWVLPISSHKVTGGVQFKHIGFNDGILKDTKTRRTEALFIEDEWRIVDSFALTGGGRYERIQVVGGHFSPRFYGVWDIIPQLTLKGGVSQGFKAPSVRNSLDGVNNVSGQGSLLTLGNSSLKPEKTTNYELGLYFDNQSGLMGNITYFHNRFKDKIADTGINNCLWDKSPNKPNCVIVQGASSEQESFNKKINIDKATTQGIELGGKVLFGERVTLALRYTYTKSEQKSGKNQGASLTRIPKHMAYTKLNWLVNDDWSVWTSAEHRRGAPRFLISSQNYDTLNNKEHNLLGDKLKSSTIVNLGTSYHFNENITVNATIYNLFNKDFSRRYYVGKAKGDYYAGDYTTGLRMTNGLSQEGRRLWLSLNTNF